MQFKSLKPYTQHIMKKLIFALVGLLLPVCMWAQMDESPATAENPIKSSDNQERVYTIFDKYKDVLIVVNAPLEKAGRYGGVIYEKHHQRQYPQGYCHCN